MLVRLFEAIAEAGARTCICSLPWLDEALDSAASSLGLQLTLLKYTIALLLAIPMGYALGVTPGTSLKHLYSMLGGVFLAQWIFGPDWIHSFISSTITYLICAIAPAKHQHLIAFAFVMGYMTMAHVYRMYVSYLSGIFDFTGMQMVLTMKLTSFAFNYFDGTADKKCVFGEHADPKVAKVYAERKRFAIQQLPNPLEYYGYVYCFTCLLAGPAFEYNDYVSSIDGSVFGTIPRQQLQTSKYRPALSALLLGLVSVAVHLRMAAAAPLSSLYDPLFIEAHSMGFRFAYTWLAVFGERLKYYFAWKTAEAASTLAGFGFQGRGADGRVQGWHGVCNLNLVEVETSASMQQLTRAWNKRTQGWLERYTYKRTGNSLVATYFISALWHGLYPGFYLFFMCLPLLTSIERLVRKKISPLVPQHPSALRAAYVGSCWLLTMGSVTYLAQVVPLGSFERSVIALGSFRYLGHVLLVAVYVVLEAMPSPHSSMKKLG